MKSYKVHSNDVKELGSLEIYKIFFTGGYAGLTKNFARSSTMEVVSRSVDHGNIKGYL